MLSSQRPADNVNEVTSGQPQRPPLGHANNCGAISGTSFLLLWGKRFVFIPRTTSTTTASTQDYELTA